jgi:hypothetical protein
MADVRSEARIEERPSGSLRVTVYAGHDPLTKRRHYICEVIPAGPTAEAEAAEALRRLVVQVDEQRRPRTAATVEQLLDQNFELLEVDPGTLGTYRSLAASHIVPLIGNVKVGALRAPRSTRLVRSCAVSRDATAPENPLLTVKVDDVDEAYAAARRPGYEVVHP